MVLHSTERQWRQTDRYVGKGKGSAKEGWEFGKGRGKGKRGGSSEREGVWGRQGDHSVNQF